MTTIRRRFEFDAGHRVLGHEGKCAHPHGHRYAAEVTLAGELDSIGRVVDFGDVKAILGSWLNEHMDHAFLVYEGDLVVLTWLKQNGFKHYEMESNPTAENIAQHLIATFRRLLGPCVVAVSVWETPNCMAEAV